MYTFFILWLALSRQWSAPCGLHVILIPSVCCQVVLSVSEMVGWQTSSIRTSTEMPQVMHHGNVWLLCHQNLVFQLVVKARKMSCCMQISSLTPDPQYKFIQVLNGSSSSANCASSSNVYPRHNTGDLKRKLLENAEHAATFTSRQREAKHPMRKSVSDHSLREHSADESLDKVETALQGKLNTQPINCRSHCSTCC